MFAAHLADKVFNLVFFVEPFIFQAMPAFLPGAIRSFVFGIVTGEAHRRAIDDLLFVPGINAIDGLIEIGLRF
jgi:hypothetical protein